jgi:hypothetical protein
VEDQETIRADAVLDLEDPEVIKTVIEVQHTFAVFGLAPPNTDIKAVYSNIMEQSLGGYYDPEDRRLVLVNHADSLATAGLLPGTEAATTATHELVHALQDQTFDLWQIHDRDYKDDDVMLAIDALVEGDATLAMFEYDSPGQLAAMASADFATTVALMSGEAIIDPTSALSLAPRIFRESLLFPYGHGLAFALRLWTQDGFRAIDRAFVSPPLSSEQILHPERYLSNTPDWPIRITLPDLTASGAAVVAENTFGEAAIRALLADLGPKMDRKMIERAADGWGGDRYAVLQWPDGRRGAMWVTTWDSAEEAREFWVASRMIPSRLKEQPSVYPDNSTFNVARRGQDVVFWIGVPSATVQTLDAQIAALPRVRLTTLEQAAPPKNTERKPKEGPEAAPVAP